MFHAEFGEAAGLMIANIKSHGFWQEHDWMINYLIAREIRHYSDCESFTACMILLSSHVSHRRNTLSLCDFNPPLPKVPFALSIVGSHFTELHFIELDIGEIPDCVREFTNLRTFRVCKCPISNLCDLRSFTKLEKLVVSRTDVCEIKLDSIFFHMRELDVSVNKLRNLTWNTIKFACPNLIRLDVNGNSALDLGSERFENDHGSSNIRVLSLSQTLTTILPARVALCLEILEWASCGRIVFPDNVIGLPCLIRLNVSDNLIDRVPACILHAPLQYLNLRKTRFSMMDMEQLEKRLFPCVIVSP